MAASGYVGGDPAKVDDDGDTMSGALVLSGAPTAPLQAATKQYVDLTVQEAVEGLEGAPPAAHTHTIGQVTGLTDALAGKQSLDAVLTGLSGLDLPPDTVLVREAGGFRLVTFTEFRDLLGVTTGGGLPNGALFNVEEHGAVADDITDCYQAIQDTLAAVYALSTGGKLYFPSLGTYRVALPASRVVVGPGSQYAAFPIPNLPRTGPKLAYGIQGVGEAYTERAAELGGTPGQVHTASVLRFDYDPADFAWDPTKGVPSVFGCADGDLTDPVGNTFSHVHFSVDDMIFRSPPDPSLLVLNLEQCSTARLGRVRFDLTVVLDQAPLCTHPTGGAFLLPRTNNNIAVQVDSVVVCGYFTGLHLTEHCEIRRAVSLRCRIGVFTRRPNSHTGLVVSLKTEQCPWGISGWDPTAATAEEAVVPIHGWSGAILNWGNEDYAYQGLFPEIYAPLVGAHINDPDGVLTGEVGAFARMNSEPVPPGGVGLQPTGGSHSIVVSGIGGTTQSPVAVFGPHHDQAATRLLPYSPPSASEHRIFAAQSGPPNSPTEGSGINVGLKVRFTQACTATEIGFWRLNGTVNPDGARLWKRTGTEAPFTWTDLGTIDSFDLVVTGEWIFADLPAPVVMATETAEPNTFYVPTIHCPGNFPHESSYWDSGPGGSGIVTGPFKVFNNTDAGGQAVFSMGDITVPPTISGGGANYGVDMVVTTEE